jgi:hypothetical protein
MHSGKCVCTSSCNTICCTIDCQSASYVARVMVSEVHGAVCVLNTALDAILGLVAADSIGIGSCDVATAMGNSGCERRGWGLSKSVGDQLRSESHHLGGAGG